MCVNGFNWDFHGISCTVVDFDEISFINVLGTYIELETSRQLARSINGDWQLARIFWCIHPNNKVPFRERARVHPQINSSGKSQRQFPVDFELMTLTKVQKYTQKVWVCNCFLNNFFDPSKLWHFNFPKKSCDNFLPFLALQPLNKIHFGIFNPHEIPNSSNKMSRRESFDVKLVINQVWF